VPGRWRVVCSTLAPELALRGVETNRDQVIERQLFRWPAGVGRSFAEPDVAQPRVERPEVGGAMVRIASSEDVEQLQSRQAQGLRLGGLGLSDLPDPLRMENGNGPCFAGGGCSSLGFENRCGQLRFSGPPPLPGGRLNLFSPPPPPPPPPPPGNKICPSFFFFFI